MKPPKKSQTDSANNAPSRKTFTFKSIDVALKDLLLDPNNYRFLDNPTYKRKIKTKFHIQTVQEATLRLLEKGKRYQLPELKKSILTNGYVPMERIIIIPYRYAKGKYTVVEGNRRVAALKSLVQEEKEGVIDLTKEQRKAFTKIPAAILQAPPGMLTHAERVIMGIRHIAGPKEWGAYQQAQLVLEMHEKEGEDFPTIADHLGISTVEVARRYRAMHALKAMEGDELYAEKAAPGFYRLFHELVALPDVRKRFGWDENTDTFAETEKAREFFELIAPHEDDTEAKLKTYSDVRKLKLIVGRPKAEACLVDPEKSFSDCEKLADVEISAEAASGLSVGEVCRDVLSQLKRINIAELSKITRADVQAVERLLKFVQEMNGAIAKLAAKDNNDSSAPD